MTVGNMLHVFDDHVLKRESDYWKSFHFYIMTPQELTDFRNTGRFVCELEFGNLILWDTPRAALGHSAYNTDATYRWYNSHGLPTSGTSDTEWLDSNCILVMLPLSNFTCSMKVATSDYKRFNRLYYEYSTVIKSAWTLTPFERMNCVYWNLNKTHRELRDFIDRHSTHRHCQLFSDSTEAVTPWWIDVVNSMYSEATTPRTANALKTTEQLAGVQSMLGLVLEHLRIPAQTAQTSTTPNGLATEETGSRTVTASATVTSAGSTV